MLGSRLVECSVAGCGRPHKAAGFCAAHYQRHRRGAFVQVTLRGRNSAPPDVCREDGCVEPVKAKGLCKAHYQRLLRHGHTRFLDRKKPPKLCSIAGCESWYYAKGLCNAHYLYARRLASTFGITLEDYAAKAAAQGGVCAICGGDQRSTNNLSGRQMVALVVDHDHITGAVRGLLCAGCNRAIGMLKDDPKVLRAAADYLERSRAPALACDAPPHPYTLPGEPPWPPGFVN